MKNVLFMAVGYTFQTLLNDVANRVFTDCWSSGAAVCSVPLIFSDQVKNSSLDELKDEIQIVADPDYFFELDDIWMI